MNLATRLTAHAADRPDDVALFWRDEALTYGLLGDRVARAAGGLRELGVGRGDRVGIVCANNPWFVVTYLATLHVGAVAVPVNPVATPTEMVAELAGTDAGVVVVGPAGRAGMASALASGELQGIVVVAAGTAAGDDLPDAQPWDGLVDHEPVEVVERSGDDLAVLAHTSGTAGSPKAAMLTHANLDANLDQAQAHPTLHIEPGDVVLGLLPLFHSYGLNAVLGLALATGSAVALAERFDPVGTLELVRERGVTVLAGVPPMFAAWLGVPDLGPESFASVRVAVSGAAPLDPEVQRAFKERFAVPLHQGYGLTEASPIVTTTGSEGEPRPGSIGVPLPGVEVRLVDANGDDVLVGDPGEIWVRGANVFAGYWRDEESTRAVLTDDGWLRTGDIAVADDDGFLWIVDRSKDLVIVSGFNVYPAEVEEVLVEHEGVAEAAVIGVAHPHTGETVKAFVVPVEGATLDEDEIVAFCARSLARYKCPTTVEVVDALPRALTGKLLRRELRV